MTGDKVFIKNALDSCGKGMECVMDSHSVERLHDFIK